MKILIVSDSHRNNERIKDVLSIEGKPNMLIHCGDAEGGEYIISQMADCPMEIVSGNNDFFSNLPPEREFQVLGKKFWLSHGHYYYVSLGTEKIIDEGKHRNADVVLFGHTHRPLVLEKDDMLIMNPGSVAYPRQEGRRGSYIVLEMSETGEMSAEVKYLPYSS